MNDETHDLIPRPAMTSTHAAAVLRRYWRERLAASPDDAKLRAHAGRRIEALGVGDVAAADALVASHGLATVARYYPEALERTHAVAISPHEARVVADAWSVHLHEREWAARMDCVDVTLLLAQPAAWNVVRSLEDQGLLTADGVAEVARSAHFKLGLDCAWELDAHGRPYDPTCLARPRDAHGYTDWEHVWAGPRDSAHPWPGEACDDAAFDEAAGRASAGEAP